MAATDKSTANDPSDKPPASRPVRKRRLFAFSLRTLFGLFTAAVLAAGAYAVFLAPYQRQRAVVHKMYERGLRPTVNWVAEIRIPEWIRNRFAHDTFSNAAFVGGLTGCKNEDLALLAQLRQLQYLDLSASDVDDGGLQYLRNLRKLENLDLRNRAVTMTGLRRFENGPSLKILHTSLPPSDEMLLRYKHSAAVVIPRVAQFEQLTDAGLKKFLEREDWNPHYQLQIRDSVLTDDGIAALLNRRLESVAFERTRIDRAGQRRLMDADPRAIAVFADRESLDPLNFFELHAPRATSADLRRTSVTLTVGERRFASDAGGYTREEWEAFFAHQRLEKSLSLGFALDDPAWYRRLEQLQHLELNYAFGPKHLREIARLPKLRSLTLRVNNQSGEDDLAPLAEATALRRLTLEYELMPPEFWRGLAAIPHLEELRLQPLSVGLSDVNVSALTHCRELRALDLTNARVTAHGLSALAELPHLALVSLRNCRTVSNAELSDLQVRYPKIQWGDASALVPALGRRVD